MKKNNKKTDLSLYISMAKRDDITSKIKESFEEF